MAVSEPRRRGKGTQNRVVARQRSERRISRERRSDGESGSAGEGCGGDQAEEMVRISREDTKDTKRGCTLVQRLDKRDCRVTDCHWPTDLDAGAPLLQSFRDSLLILQSTLSTGHATCARRSGTLSSFSQGRSRSSLPKCPYAEVGA